jgi:hypothetical protein
MRQRWPHIVDVGTESETVLQGHQGSFVAPPDRAAFLPRIDRTEAENDSDNNGSKSKKRLEHHPEA